MKSFIRKLLNCFFFQLRGMFESVRGSDDKFGRKRGFYPTIPLTDKQTFHFWILGYGIFFEKRKIFVFFADWTERKKLNHPHQV